MLVATIASDPKGRQTAQHDEQPEAAGPIPDLRRNRKRRLEQKWIRNQRRQRADIRQCVEPIRRTAWIRSAEPGLPQRPGGRENEIRQPDGAGEQSEDSPCRIAGRIGLPSCRRHDVQSNGAATSSRPCKIACPRHVNNREIKWAYA